MRFGAFKGTASKPRKRARLPVAIALLLSLAVGWSVPAMAADTPSGPIPEATPEFLEQGREVYVKRCSFCHGLLGDGEGPAAEFLDPRPRDFTLGVFKFRTTDSGELPTNEDMFRTVSNGLPGTGMQAFDDGRIKNGLSEDERWAVIAYIKTFVPEFDDPEFDPYKKIISLPANRPASSEALIAKGREVFEHAKCWECHGKQGRGDGQKAFDRKDDWGFPIRIRNVTFPWKIKGGSQAEDIYMRFSTGINGTPMPSFVKALGEDERWALANFIESLQHQLTEHQVLKALKVDGELPEAADDPLWATAEAMDVRLAGQVIAAPRWQNPSIDLVTLRAIYNEQEITFLAVWDDPFKDVTHVAENELDPNELRVVGGYNTYVNPYDVAVRQLENFRDSVALQFPAKPPKGTAKPHFFRGSSSEPTNLWIWRADREAAGETAVEEATARGWKQEAKAQPEDQQQVSGQAVWGQGRWSVVMKRPLTTEDKADVQFIEGSFIPLAVNVWDGSNGEHGMMMSLSTWHFVTLEAPMSWTVYLYGVIAMLVAGALSLLFIWLAKRERKPQDEDDDEAEAEA
ncbi:MAG: ethylbenzene dehydrogenase-related protein [Alphaproteobacteria bacterium]|jgi:DMSO reductase family type II enzyme heme b subunit|nr:ethylbenzene dehydrogenase-related protein [Alphaproteobacteria bacterium]